MREREKVSYPMLSVLQYAFAILVIMLHCQRLFVADEMHFIQKSIFSRMAVPFFLMSSAYMIRLKSVANPHYLRAFFSNLWSQYLFWSVLYVPYAVWYFGQLNLPLYYLPFGLIAAVLYLGMCYQLWYIPATMLGVFGVEKVQHRIGFKATVVVALILYLLGSVETYSAYLEGSIIADWYHAYKSILFTSRNGIFYVPIFICLGYLVYDLRETALFRQWAGAKVVFAFLLFAVEGVVVYYRQGLDKNFFFALLPFTTFLLNWSLRTNWLAGSRLGKLPLKQYSVLYFFIHPMFVEIFSLPWFAGKMSAAWFGWFKLVATLACTHGASVLFLKLEKRARFLQKK